MIGGKDHEAQPQDTNFEERFFIFTENRFICFKDDTDTQERGILKMRNARLKKVTLKDSN